MTEDEIREIVNRETERFADEFGGDGNKVRHLVREEIEAAVRWAIQQPWLQGRTEPWSWEAYLRGRLSREGSRRSQAITDAAPRRSSPDSVRRER
jgi:hypothetical protein